MLIPQKANVAVVIIHHKPTLEWHEEVSLRQCKTILHKRDRYLVCPSNLSAKTHQSIDKDLRIVRVLPSCLSTYHNFNVFKCSPNLYHFFSKYDWILFYELDCFVFEDKLDYFCDQQLDYVGAPWFVGFDKADPTSEVLGVGNGGFSLRRTTALTKTLAHLLGPPSITSVTKQRIKHIARLPIAPPDSKTRQTIESKLTLASGQEDLFWSNVAPLINPGFRVASYNLAREFSFEANAQRLFTEIGRLPFGCHKWHVYDKAFWQPHISALLKST